MDQRSEHDHARQNGQRGPQQHRGSPAPAGGGADGEVAPIAKAMTDAQKQSAREESF